MPVTFFTGSHELQYLIYFIIMSWNKFLPQLSNPHTHGSNGENQRVRQVATSTVRYIFQLTLVSCTVDVDL